MKFNEFVALDEQLQKDGTSINKLVKEVTGEYLFEEELMEKKPEDPDKLSTGGDGLKRVTSPRFAKARRKLTNNAKKFKQIAETKLINKYLPKQLEQLKDLANKAAGMRADNKNPKEILKALSGELKKIGKIHEKATLQIEEAVEKMEGNFDKRVQSIINNEKLNEKSQLKLSTYWMLLMTQVRQILYKQLITKRAKSVEDIASKNPELKEMLAKITKLPHTEAEMARMAKEQAAYKKKYSEMGNEEEMGDEEIEFKVGEEYQYTSKSGNTTTIEITEVGEDGKVLAKNDKNPKGFKINKEKVGKKIKEAEDSEGEGEGEDTKKTATQYKDDIEGEKDEKLLTTLYDELQKAEHLNTKDKEKLLTMLKKKGIPKEKTA